MSTTKSQDQMKYTATGDFVIIRCSFIVPKPETKVALIFNFNFFIQAYICFPLNINLCCAGGIPSFSSTLSLIRSTLSVGSISISI